MSWFAELAGKAESLLEKVDNTAANVLQVEEGDFKNIPLDNSSTAPASHVPLESRVSDESVGAGSIAASGGNKLGPSAPVKPRQPVSAPRQPQAKPGDREKADDLLFEFLNSNGPAAAAKERKQSKPRVTTQDSPGMTRKARESPQPGMTDAVDAGSGQTSSGTSTPAEPSVLARDDAEPTPAAPEEDTAKEPPSQSMGHESPSQPAPAVHHPANDRASNLELENKLLRKEVSSLNEEMVSQLQRAKEAEKRAREMEQHLGVSQHQLSVSEGIVRQLRTTEDDFNEALSAKDSQLAVLRVRIQEADNEIQRSRLYLDEHKLERERLLQDHTDSAGVHNHALDVMKDKLDDAERKVAMEVEARRHAQQEAMERQTKLEQEQQAMAESMKNLQKRLQEEKNKASEQVSALKMSKANLEATRQEMKDYKEKAGRILQAKDKVISTLREGKQGDSAMSGVTSAEYDEVCQERDALKEDLNQTRYRVEQLKNDLQDVEHHQQSEADMAQERIESIEAALEEERKRREACEEEIRIHTQNAWTSKEELQRCKTSLMGQIQERETEIQRLRNQIATKALTSTSETELENRVRALTENLIQKQTVIEALSTEKNSLVLQLERLEQQYRDVQASSARHITSMHINSADDNDENTLSRVQTITSVMPSQINDSRRVKRAVNEIDKCSIRLGLFLRRYPVARLFVILYMILLHIWVLVVLLTYKPEMHDVINASLPQKPPNGT